MASGGFLTCIFIQRHCRAWVGNPARS